jgi:hypothetical protein
MKRLALGIVALVGCFVHLEICSAQVPVLQRTIPLGIPPGKASSVRLVGTELVGVREVWTSFPTASPVVAEPPTDPAAKPDPKRAVYLIQPADDAVPGIYALRVATATGVSGLRLMLIDDLPTTTEVATNDAAERAQILTLPTAVDGACEAERTDHYAFTVKAGQRLSFEVVAKRIASTLDPLLRLVDAKGRVLAESDDDSVVGADARFTYVFETAGDYRLELRDIRYGGNGNYFYRLRIGDFPLVAAPFPAAVSRGSKSSLEATMLEAVGAKPATLDPLKVDVPAKFADAMLPLVVRRAAGQGSGFTAALVTDVPEQLESEPNNDAKQATAWTVGSAMNGRFAAPRDRDFFRFAGKKGDKLRVAGRTRSLGSPTDLYLQLYSGDGKRLIVETDDAGLDEGVLTATLDADGDYLLVVEDLIGRGGPEFVYRLESGSSVAPFSAAVDLEKFDVPFGGLASAKIAVTRSGYDGEIRFRVEGAPGVEVIGTAAAGKPDAALLLAIPPNYPTGTLLNLRLIGEAVDGDAKVEVGSAAAQRKALGGMSKLPPSLQELIVVGVTPAAKEQFTLSAKVPAVKWNADGTQGELVVDVERKKGFADVVKLIVCGLPDGYTAGNVTIAKEKNEGTIVIKGPKAKTPPPHSFYVIGTATVKKLMVQSSLVDVNFSATAKKAVAEKAVPEKAVAKQPVVAQTAEPKPKQPAVVKGADTKPAAPSPLAKASPPVRQPMRVDP